MNLDGKELMLIIVATILTLTTPTGSLSPDHCLIYLTIFRILLGIGVGGDYPMSASVTSDRSNLRKRGTMLAYIFSNQGWGSFVGGLVTLIVLAAYKGVIDGKGQISKVDGGKLIDFSVCSKKD
jgi:MFS transporter, PHS family, inorganic phosphate transporter